MRFQHGQVVAFLGDSITQHPVAVDDWMETQSDGLPPIGTSITVKRYEPRGWTMLIANRIRLAYPERRIRYENAGIGGNSSRQMLARIDADVLVHRPDWLLLSTGVVEVRRTFQPDRATDIVPLDEYAANLTKMVCRAKAVGAQVILLEPTPHARPVTGGPPAVTLDDVNALTRQYAAGMAQVARDNDVPFIPLFEAFRRIENLLNGQASLHADEVHLSLLGDMLYAQIVYDYLDTDVDE